MAEKTATVDSAPWFDDESMAKSYPIGEQVTGLQAERLIKASGVIDSKEPLFILDNACGIGTVTDMLFQALSDEQKNGDLQVIAGDVSEYMVNMAKGRIQKNGWPQASAQILDMQDMSALASDSLSHVFTNFGIMFPPDADKAMSEIGRVLKPNGINAFTTWKSVSWVDHVKKAFEGVPGAPTFPDQFEGFKKTMHGNPWHELAFVKSMLEKCGFTDIQVQSSPAVLTFQRQQFVAIFGGPVVRSMLTAFWGEEDAEKYRDSLAPALKKHLQDAGLSKIDVRLDAIIAVAKKA